MKNVNKNKYDTYECAFYKKYLLINCLKFAFYYNIHEELS